MKKQLREDAQRYFRKAGDDEKSKIRVGKVHDLRRLIDDCANSGNSIPLYLEKIDILTHYGIVGRYEDVPFKHPFSRPE